MFCQRLTFLQEFPTLDHENPLHLKTFSPIPTKTLKILLLILTRPEWKTLKTFHLTTCHVDQINTRNSLELLRVVNVALQKTESSFFSTLAPLYWFSNLGWWYSDLIF